MSPTTWPHKRESCLEWKGNKDRDGYGRSFRKGRDVRVHRAFYEAWYGVELTPEQVLLHSCDNPKCFNPYHLTVGTQADNVRDMDTKKRRVSANSFVTHCPQGHEYTKDNTIVYRDGKRRCRTCREERKNG